MKQIAGRYNIISKLGQGGMGIVYKAYDRLEKTEVALKQVLLPPGQLDFASKAGTDDTDKLRLSLAQEFSILATLRHPHILSVLDFGFDDDGHPFYTMTLLEGGQDVKSYAEDLSQDEKMRVLTQMLQALHYLHRRGILHRDLKPDNVFVTREEQVKVMDFGLAKQNKAQSSAKDTISGTISYMVPELFQGGKTSVASDLFAVGVMAYEIMVGQHPFEAETVGERILKIMTHAPDFSPIPGNFVPWLQTILAKDASKRFPTAYDAMIAFFEAVGVELPAEDQTIRESFLQASTFVGRDAELKRLTEALETLQTENAFFLIGGESGVGKSRLLDELRVRALVAGSRVLRGQGVDGGGLPFQLWRNITRHLLLMVEVTDLQASILKDIVPDMDALLGREVAKAPELTGKAYQERMVLTLVDLFRKSPQPVVLLLEDVQWADESLTVLEQMLKVREQLPKLMIVATYRNDDAPDLPAKLTGMSHIKLERLTPDAVSELSSAILGDVGTNEKVVKLLHSQSEGNLFFLVETVRALAEASGDLQRIGQGELPEGVFTGGMQAITRRRLSKVDAQYSAMQTLAAIIGREIDTKLLEHAYDAVLVEAWLRNAADYGVVSIQDNVWRFAHDKLREALIADIPDDALPQIHRTAAETIEAVYPDDAGYNEALFAHWQAVGDLDKTYAYLLPVAKHMIEISGTYIIAEAYLHQMLERLPEDDARRVALWNWLADSAERQGNYSASQGYALQAQELATSLDDRAGLATSLYNQAIIAYIKGQYDRASQLQQQSLSIRTTLEDQQGVAQCLNHMGIVTADQGDFAAASLLFQQSLAIQQGLGDKRGIANSLNNLATVVRLQGDFASALDLYQQSLDLKQELGDKRGVASNLANLGVIAKNQADYTHAQDLYQRSLAIQRDLGDQKSIALRLNDIGFLALKQGDKPAAISHFVKSLRISCEIRMTALQLHNIIGLSQVLQFETMLERAARFLGLAKAHPSADAGVQRAIKGIMPQIEAALSPDELAQALDQGKALDLDTVVQELLDEFAPSDENTADDNA